MMEAKIDTLIWMPDNIEVIRDQVSAILKIELKHQEELAKKENDANDYRIGVWKEKTRPWQLDQDNEKNNPFPLVNVQLMGYSRGDQAGSDMGDRKLMAEIIIDCYAHGEFEATEPDDTNSALEAWRIARIVRNIITSEHYAYLGLRGMVRSVKIREGKTGDPRNKDGSAQSITICRLVLEIEYSEKQLEVKGSKFEEYNFVASSPNGEVLFKMSGKPGIKEDDK